MKLLISVLIALLITAGLAGGVPIALNQLNLTQDFNSALHGVLNGSQSDDVSTVAQVEAANSSMRDYVDTAVTPTSLTSSSNISMDNSTPLILHVGNVEHNQTVQLLPPEYNKNSIYTISVDVFTSYYVTVWGNLTAGNLTLANGDIVRLLSNGTSWGWGDG